MTVQELNALLTEFIKIGDGHLIVHIHAITGGLSGTSTVALKEVSRGIDWDASKLLLYPEKTLFGEALARKRRNR